MITLNQKSYIEAMAKKFGQDSARLTHTPLEPGIILSKDQCPKVPIDEPYQVACSHVLWPYHSPGCTMSSQAYGTIHAKPGN